MILAFAFALAQATATPSPSPSPYEVFSRAQRAWQARIVPPYVSFEVDCASTFLAPKCPAGAQLQFVVRASDGSSFAQTVPSGDAPAKVLMRGGHITGPLATPLGFYRSLNGPSGATGAPPANLAPDPLATIATVTSAGHVYDVTPAGEETLDGRRTYHLVLKPEIDPDRYPLRALWVDEATSEVVQLTYERPYDEQHTRALVWYRFAPAGPRRVWTIVHIEASAPARNVSVADDLTDISFPENPPDWYFVPDAP